MHDQLPLFYPFARKGREIEKNASNFYWMLSVMAASSQKMVIHDLISPEECSDLKSISSVRSEVELKSCRFLIVYVAPTDTIIKRSSQLGVSVTSEKKSIVI